MSKGYTENEALAKAYKAIEYSNGAKLCIVLHRHLLYLEHYSYFAFLSSFDQRKNKINPADNVLRYTQTPLSK
jgi:DHA2 family multidrug resistance protein